MEKRKRIDAIRMVRQIRDTHYEQTKHMTKEERLAFYQKKGKQAQANLERLAELVDTNKAEERV
jgi:hypothetical protein